MFVLHDDVQRDQQTAAAAARNTKVLTVLLTLSRYL